MSANRILDRLNIEHDILVHVRQALCIATDSPIVRETAHQWLERFCFLGESFRRHITRLFMIEEEEGYMDFLADSPRPTLQHAADVLLREHTSLARELSEILADARGTSSDNLSNLHGLKQRLSGLVSRYDQHRTKENDLWSEAVVDIGGEG
jgi:hypothetical protein